jgi:IPT/TIG domain
MKVKSVRSTAALWVRTIGRFAALCCALALPVARAQSPIPADHIPGYDVGVDYHTFGSDFNSTAFITQYDQPGVRQTVQAQLQGMADHGATFIHTSIWFVTEPGTTNFGEAWRATFPMTDQEAANLRAYAQDVAAVVSASGGRLRLDIALMWLGAADYTIGSPTTGLGYSNLSASEFNSRIEVTTDKVLVAVGDVMRPDGVQVVDTIYFDPEVLIPGPGDTGGKPNEGWFLLSNYSRFVSAVSAKGIRPSVYFMALDKQTDILDDSYVDSLYPILDGHRSMFWIYRSINFMVNNGLPLPSRIDFSCYLTSTGAPYDELLQRVLDDADATLPSLGAPRSYGAVETYYLLDSSKRLQYGQAFASQAAQDSRLRRVSFWTTPDGGGSGQDAAYPFSIEDFLPPLPSSTIFLLSSAAVPPGSLGFELTVHGTNFDSSSIVQWNGLDLPTTFVSSTELIARVPDSLLATAGTAQVTVFKPAPAGSKSNALTFNITSAASTAVPAGQYVTYIPHSAYGGGWITRLFVANLTNESNTVTINRMDQSGNVVASQALTLGPSAMIQMADSELTRSLPLTINWFAIGSQGPVLASVLFDFQGAAAPTPLNYNTAIGALASPPLTAFTAIARVTSPGGDLGLALANLNNTSNTVTVRLYGQDGNLVAQDAVTLGPFMQTAFDLTQDSAFMSILTGTNEFVGTLTATTSDATKPVSALVVGANKNQLFSLPVVTGVAR